VHHAGDVERDGRKQQVADDILQAQRDQAEDDLPHEQASAAMKYSLATAAIDVFEVVVLCHGSFLSAFDVGRPLFGVDLGWSTSGTRPDRRAAAREVELRHLAAAGGVGGLAFIQALMKSAAAALVDVAQLGREVGAFAQQRVAADAVARFPQMLAAHHEPLR
jgi:hypothetical protein